MWQFYFICSHIELKSEIVFTGTFIHRCDTQLKEKLVLLAKLLVLSLGFQFIEPCFLGHFEAVDC